jgi:hypothetical protein
VIDIDATWRAFCDQLCQTLQSTGDEIIRSSPTTLDRDEGLRVLLRDVRYLMEREIEERDVDFPVFAQTTRDTYHMLADAPDYGAFDARISGHNEYLLRGQIGLADAITFTTMGPDPADDGGSVATWSPWAGASEPVRRSGRKVVTGTLDGDDLDVDADGRFEVTLSVAAPSSATWLPIKPWTDRVVVRNIFRSGFRDHRRHGTAKLVLEKIGGQPTPPPYSTEQLLEGLEAVLGGAGRITLGRPKITERIQMLGNGRFSNDDTFWKSSGSNPRTRFQEAYWSVQPDQALVVELADLPPASFWMLSLTNHWMESLDFRFHSMYVNSDTAVTDENGALRAVLAHRDPGTPNWLDVAGHTHGVMLWRWNDVDDVPDLPRTTLMSFDEAVAS